MHLAGVSLCSVNTYGAVSSTTCSACSAGTYCPVGSVTPSPCPIGFFCPATDAVLDALPRVCPVGSFCNAYASILCPTGQYCPTPALFASVPCAWGKFNPSVGMTNSTACQPCPSGLFASPDFGACVSICPVGSVSLVTFSKSVYHLVMLCSDCHNHSRKVVLQTVLIAHILSSCCAAHSEADNCWPQLTSNFRRFVSQCDRRTVCDVFRRRVLPRRHPSCPALPRQYDNVCA